MSSRTNEEPRKFGHCLEDKDFFCSLCGPGASPPLRCLFSWIWLPGNRKYSSDSAHLRFFSIHCSLKHLKRYGFIQISAMYVLYRNYIYTNISLLTSYLHKLLISFTYIIVWQSVHVMVQQYLELFNTFFLCFVSLGRIKITLKLFSWKYQLSDSWHKPDFSQ